MQHYYGDIVRKLFVAGAVVMALTLPFFANQIAEPLSVSILGILVIGVAAGLASPRYFGAALVNLAISLGAVMVFEFYAVNSTGNFFWVNQLLALIFLIAAYYSIKTVRGMSSSGNRWL